MSQALIGYDFGALVDDDYPAPSAPEAQHPQWLSQARARRAAAIWSLYAEYLIAYHRKFKVLRLKKWKKLLQKLARARKVWDLTTATSEFTLGWNSLRWDERRPVDSDASTQTEIIEEIQTGSQTDTPTQNYFAWGFEQIKGIYGHPATRGFASRVGFRTLYHVVTKNVLGVGVGVAVVYAYTFTTGDDNTFRGFI